MALYWFGLALLGLFYASVVAVGLWTGMRRGSGHVRSERIMLAGRQTGLFVGICTLTATWVDGSLLTSTVDVVANRGLLWCQLPVAFVLSLVICGAFFAGPMWRAGHTTMLDPLQVAFRSRATPLLFLPIFSGGLLYCGSILKALGATVNVVTGLDPITAMSLSATVAVLYTALGGLYSVRYTDIVQLICILIGMWLCVPFLLSSEHKGDLSSIPLQDWTGRLELWQLPSYLDTMFMLTLGSVVWQGSFQRLLSAESESAAKIMAYAGALGMLLVSVGAVLLGCVSRFADWDATTYGDEHGSRSPLGDNSQSSFLLPLTLHYFTPAAVSSLGQGAVAAAAMSSIDSALLSMSTLFTRNIYVALLRPQAPERELVWTLRLTTALAALVGVLVAVSPVSVYGLSVLSSDYLYIILFPQFVAAVHFPSMCNAYGSLAAFCLGLALRFLVGEPFLGLPAVLGGHDPVSGEQLFPVKTAIMLVSLITLLVASAATKTLLEKLPPKYDVLTVRDSMRDATLVLVPQLPEKALLDADLLVYDLLKTDARKGSLGEGIIDRVC
uniref:Putative choline transporter n=1 Tax=Ixodes ricinus TaxID=34613 RepID=A0A147BBD2_IXORI